VSCQLEVLRHCFPPSVRYVLEELPDNLDETYERILREIRKPNQRHAHRLLQCLVVAARPLQVEELAEVLAFDFSAEGMPKLIPSWRWEDEEEAVMSACSSLVTIVEDNDSHSRVVQFSHFSVKEFLTADRLAEPMRDVSRYHIRLEAAHTILAKACLGVLLRLDERIHRNSINAFPLVQYAAQYWPTHARVENVSSRIKDGMECLFDANKPYFATWLWIYDDDGWVRSLFTERPEKPAAVPLYYAARLGFRQLAEHLIAEHPEHLNAEGGDEVTPMHAAAAAGHANILSLLIDHGADSNGRTMNGHTPLRRASRNGKLEAGKLLLSHGADINARDKYNNTALMGAVYQGHVEFARMLLERGAPIEARTHAGRTALHYAAITNQVECAQLLLDRGANVKVSDISGFTPSSCANAAEIVELMSGYGGESVNM
jgi:ankyrin repeat protein